MIKLTAREAASATRGEINCDPNTIITNVFTDNRRAVKGGLFAAIPGEHTDGHMFVAELTAAGYICLVSKKEYFIPGTILVENTKKAVYDLAVYYRNEKVGAVKTIAITGSVGKTTVKDMTGLVLSSRYNTFVTEGNSNSLLGVPISVMSVNTDHEYAVLELGMSERGEISALSRLVKPSLSIITNIGSSHLEALGSRENIRKEKFDILSGEEKGNAVILDGDAEYEFSQKNSLNHKTVYCGITNKDSDFTAENIEATNGATAYDAVWGDKRRSRLACQKIVIPAEGLHNVKNSLYAFAAGILCGVSPESAAASLARFIPTGDRQRIYEKGGITVIADCYNASPESMKAALGVLSTKSGRKIAVLGDMLELGEDEKRFHADNARLAASSADILIFYGNFAALCKSALPDEKAAYAFGFGEKAKAVSLLNSLLQPGDVVLFKGSRRMKIDEIIKEATL